MQESSPPRLRRLATVVAFAVLGTIAAGQARANNGLDFIGAGLESFAMGGADLGVARDPLALSTNPAGLAWQRAIAVEQELAVAHELGVGFSDTLNGQRTVANIWAPLANGGITLPLTLAGRPVTLSSGLFLAGGSGASFKNVVTPFGTTDRLSAQFGILKLSAGGAVAVTDRLSIGISGALYYAKLNQKLFPGTSALVPGGAFFGTTIPSATSISSGVRIGLQYKLDERATVGAIYNSQVELPLSGDHLIADESAIGLGAVTYSHVHIKGFSEPQEFGAGIAYRVTDRLLIDADLRWLDWSAAMRNLRLSASGPNRLGAPASLASSSALNWRNQVVLSVGAAYELSPDLTMWAGYNYGPDPIPSSTLNPLLAAIGEHHLTAGVGWRFAPGCMVGTALEFLVPTREDSTNPSLPLGGDVSASTGYLAVHLGFRAQL